MLFKRHKEVIFIELYQVIKKGQSNDLYLVGSGVLYDELLKWHQTITGNLYRTQFISLKIAIRICD